MIRSMLTTGLLAFAVTGAAQAANWTATASTVQTVMAKARGGDTIKLVGAFGEIKLYNQNYASLVAIDASAASFSNTLLLSGISNINIIGGHFGSDSAATAYNKAVEVIGGTNVSFTNPNVIGYYTGQGIVFQGTANASVTGATLSKLQAGIVFGGVTAGSISNSQSVGSVSDGFDIIDSSHIDVGHNSCTATTALIGAHPDCIQLFSSKNAQPLDHINIHDNYASGQTQGFDNFGSVAGDSFISMTNNRIDGLMPQGVACYNCVNSTIANNTMTSLDGASYMVKMSVVGGSHNIISGNSIGAFNRADARPNFGYTLAQLSGHAVLAASGSIAVVPEPASWAMLLSGFTMVGLGQRSRRQALAA